jgi:hypothetical protein
MALSSPRLTRPCFGQLFARLPQLRPATLGTPMHPAAEPMISRGQLALGESLGDTLLALIELAAQLRPEDPPNAFAALWLRLLDEQDLELEARDRLAPPGVSLFAWTGGDGNCFGFLMDGHASSVDERPVVRICPMDGASSYEVVASNLRDFLGLVAFAFAEVVTRNATDREWANFRTEWYGHKPAILAAMSELSKHLVSIPGVTIPASPSSVANAFPNRSFVG